MDPMSQAEEERRLKEEAEFKELSDTVFLNEGYFNSRDLTKKGREVHPAGKQAKEIKDISKTIKFTNQVQVDNYDDNVAEFSLTAKPRIFISHGFINRREPDKILRKVTRKFMFLFNDLIIITIKKDGAEMYEAQQMLWVKDLRIKHLMQEEGGEDNSLSFELLVNKTRSRPKYSIIFTCDNDDSKRGWMTDIENVLLAYHRDTPFSKQLGWFHDIIQGTFWSSAYLGDHTSMRKHLKNMSYRGQSIALDAIDDSGMSALHWAVFKGHEVCTRLLLDRGADVDILQGGFNTPLLLAAACGYENIARMLIDKGADMYARNNKDHDAVFMAVVYGHASKGLPWLLQLLNAKGLDLNQSDSHGATPLHLCAQKNLARPVRMLVDSGAEVNAKHGKTQLTPLQMACSHAHPDVETIRSFLDKGAYPNWKDVEGRTAFQMAMNSQHLAAQTASAKPTTDIFTNSPMIGHPGGVQDVNQLLLGGNTEPDRNSIASSKDGRDRSESNPVYQQPGGNGVMSTPTNGKWRAMEGTLEKVGDWAVKALPALLEISKKGGRFEEKDLEVLRPSFRAAVMEAHEVWLKKQEPSNFVEFVMIREQSGEDLRLHKEAWLKNNSSNICSLCSDPFGMTNRKHHCRACGVLCCDPCSSKRVQLTAMDDAPNGGAANSALNTPATPTGSFMSSILGSSSKSSRNSVANAPTAEKLKEEKQERICDGCFNRLIHEAAQPSPDHFRVKQLKQCALDVIQSIEDLIDSLDDPEGDPHHMQHSVRETQALTRGLEALSTGRASQYGGTPSKGSRPVSASFSQPSVYQTPPPAPRTGEGLVDVLKIRDSRLVKSEDFIAKFLEAADGYHKITKKLIEQKQASSRLWGGAT